MPDITFEEHCQHYIDRARSILAYIGHIGNVVEERETAMQSLVDDGNEFCVDVRESHQYWRNDYYGDDEIFAMDDFMSKLVRSHHQACKVGQQDWDPT